MNEVPHAAALASFQTPFLLVDLGAVRANVQHVLGALGGDPARWRPHLKTTKLAGVYRELLRAGLTDFKCATTREAAVMLDVARDEGRAIDLLVAYPHAGPALARLGTLAEIASPSRLSVLIESAGDAARVPGTLGLFIDVDCGMHRTGVPATAVERVADTARAAGARWRGLHAYEGHVVSGAFAARCEQVADAHADVELLMQELSARRLPVETLVTSGTPSCLPAARWAGWSRTGGVHQVSPGTVVFSDVRTRDVCAEFDLRPAALVHARVVSAPTEDRLTCDAGSKALATDAGDPCAEALDHPELQALCPSEEHLPLHVEGETAVTRGDLVRLLPRHVCPTVNLADEVVLVDGGRVVGLERVVARGHEILGMPEV